MNIFIILTIITIISLQKIEAFDVATVKWGKEPIKVSSTGPDSTLPNFFFMAGGEEGGSMFDGYGYTGGKGNPSPYVPPDGCPDEIFENTMKDERVPQLPWALQESWGCERKPTEVDAIIIENDYLRAAVTPQWGGKIWSLYNKKLKRQVFYNNPAHQPDNIGYRKAWTSGGCEWNWAPGKIGHSVFTESPVYTAIIPSGKGNITRVWEYDRQNNTVWSVDILIIDDVLFAHPKIRNPTDVEIPGYWWTCVAMPVTDNTRIITPAEASLTPCTPWPAGAWTNPNTTFRGSSLGTCREEDTCAWQQDMSWLGNIPHPHDFFMMISPEKVPYITHVTDDGFATIHSHPKKMKGTKFFTWGQSGMGAFQQDFMSASDYENPKCDKPYYDPYCEHYEHEGRYTELQIGPAPSQMHTFPIAKNSSYEWTEWFKSWNNGDIGKLHSSHYNDAVDEVNKWMDSKEGMSQTELDEIDQFMEQMADVKPLKENIVYEGMPWGGLREKLVGQPIIANGATPFFPPKYTEETRCWLDLIVNGTFSEETLQLNPINFEISDEWVALLQKSIANGHSTWLHYLFLGTVDLEKGNAKRARELFIKSFTLKKSVHGARNLAIFSSTKTEAIDYYKQAWDIWKTLDPNVDVVVERLGADLTSEFAGWLVGNEEWAELNALLNDIKSNGISSSMKENFLNQDKLLHAQACIANQNKDYDTAIKILTKNCFPTYGSLRNALIQLWFEANVIKAETKKGSSLSVLETVHLRRELGCGGDSETTLSYKNNCIRGPPNLGYAYGRL